ncbi:MAG: nucleotidyltransferase domain-containing protein [Nanoarchaeota archaeon]|nr:nucleotidyltransferase domain-containing protein [Nanoarchaeota archaeon]MBU4124122.1 nucleotidyltransferase domain-containing protein [Nanoarchaeota archaeon]
MDKILKQATNIITKSTGKDLITLILMGSYGTKDMVKTSDIDLNAIMKDSFDFRKERQIKNMLKEQIEKKYKIETNFECMNIGAFYGKKKKGSLTKYISLPILITFFNESRFLYGKKINFNKFSVKRASLEKQLKYHIKSINDNVDKFKGKDMIGTSWYFKDFIKGVFLLADVENQILNKKEHKKRYIDIYNEFKKDRTHIIHYTMTLRRKKRITNREKLKWIKMAKQYIKNLKMVIK